MSFALIISILSLVVLVILHELGHFLFAKKFGIKVEEFGIGLPWSPRLFSKKVGDTTYSFYPLLLGAFVRLEGEEGASDSSTSFKSKPVWQRFVVVAGGVGVFWLIAAIIFSILGATSGVPLPISDSIEANIKEPRVQISAVAPDSPASEAGLLIEDTIRNMETEDIRVFGIDKVGTVQEFVQENGGKEATLTIERHGETLQVVLTPRADPPVGQGAMGVGLVRTGLVQYVWYEAPYQGVILTAQLTSDIVKQFYSLIVKLVGPDEVGPGVQVAGPIGVLGALKNAFTFGIPHFLAWIALLSIYLAIFNTIPIPALDGGQMLFLLIEGIRRKPLPEKAIQRAILVSMLILIGLLLWVSVIDITRLF